MNKLEKWFEPHKLLDRDKRIRNEALEEAARQCDLMASDDALMLAKAIRGMKLLPTQAVDNKANIV